MGAGRLLNGIKNPVSRRRIQNFIGNKRAYISLYVFLTLFIIGLLAELTANDKPILVSFGGRLHFPVFKAYLETECPKGQMGFLVVGDGTAVPLRARARSSSFCNLSVISELCRGCLVADVPAVLGSLDIVLGEVDR